MRTWFSQLFKGSHRRGHRSGKYRPVLEQLELRCLLAAPVIDPIINVTASIPGTIGKTIFIPVTASDADGDALTFTINGNTSGGTIDAQVRTTGNTYLLISVAGFGDMEFQLFGDLAPQTVSIISGLVKSEFYNGLIFHRVAQGFVIQGGDPLGTGFGGPGFTFNDEFNAAAIFSGKGQLAMANSGDDTNGSQFFVTVGQPRTPPNLDFNHTIFGQLIRGFDVLTAINQVPTTPAGDGKPNTPVVITSAQIVQDNHDAVLVLKALSTTGTGTITVQANDGHGGITTRSFNANIVTDVANDPAFLNPVSDQATPVNTQLMFSVAGTDLENDPLTFTAVQTGTINPDVNVSISGSTVTVTPSNGFVGPVKVLIGVSDAGHNQDTQTITVAVGNRTITNASPVNVTATEGTSTGVVPVATFTDADGSATASDYTASINWGDGHVTTGTVTNTLSSFTVTGTNTYKDSGKFPIKVTITLNASLGGNVATVNGTATVAEAPLSSQGVPVTSKAGLGFANQTVATFTDADPNGKVSKYTATINWGDGTTSTGSISATASGFQVQGSHTYATPGNFTISTLITDPNTAGEVANATATATATSNVVLQKLIATGAGSGSAPEVKVFDAETNALLFDFNAYDAAFRGGVRVAVGDVNGDFIPDIITAPGPGGGTLIQVFSGKDVSLVRAFMTAYPTDQFGNVFTGGLFVASGDINNDSFADVLVTPDATGGPLVHVYGGLALTQGKDSLSSLLIGFNVVDTSYRGGLHIAAGDVDGDHFADIIVSFGTGSSEIKVYNSQQILTTPIDPLTQLTDFTAFDAGVVNAIFVAAGDVDGDGKADIIAGPGAGSSPTVKVFSGKDSSLLNSFSAYDASFLGGVTVGAIDANGDGKADIVTGAGPNGAPNVKVFDGVSLAVLDNFFAYDSAFRGGVFVSGGN